MAEGLSDWLISRFKIDSVLKWHAFADITEIVAYFLYSVLKFILLLFVVHRYCQNCCKPRCQNGCKTQDCQPRCKLSCIRKITAKLALSLYSAPKGYVSNFDTYKEDAVENGGIPSVYIRHHVASQIDVAIMAMVMVTLCLVILSTFWYKFWVNIDIYNTCKNVTGIQCYPQSRDTGKLLSNYSITDCSQWEAMNNVEFQCFYFKLDIAETAVILGGLISLFLKITTKGPLLFTSVAECMVEKRDCKCCECCSCCNHVCKYCTLCLCSNCFSKCKCFTNRGYCCESNRILCREVLAFIFNVVDCLLSFTIGCGYVAHISGLDIYGKTVQVLDKNAAEAAYIIFDSFNRVILPLGILSTILLIPFEDYLGKKDASESNEPSRCDSDIEPDLPAATKFNESLSLILCEDPINYKSIDHNQATASDKVSPC